jgi:hypothetical protein
MVPAVRPTSLSFQSFGREGPTLSSSPQSSFATSKRLAQCFVGAQMPAKSMHDGRHQPCHHDEKPKQDHGEQKITIIDGFFACPQPHGQPTGHASRRSAKKTGLAYWIIRLAAAGIS